MRIAGVLLLLAVFGVAAGRSPGAVTAVRTARVHTVSNGVIERAIIIIEDGKIRDVRASGEIPEGATVIDASIQVVIPGIIDAHASLADSGRDADETIAQDVRAADGIDYYASGRRMLAGGVSTLYVTPGSRRLLTGQGAVVKTAGRGPAGRLLAASHGLRITLGEEPKNPPALFKPPVSASSGDPIRPARSQYPASRMGQFAALRDAAAAPGPLRDGKHPLMVLAHNADDLVKAVLFAGEIGRPIVLLDAEEAVQVADLLAAKKVDVIFNPAYAPGHRDVADEARPALEATGTLNGPLLLEKAGVRFALHAPSDGDTRDLLFIAGAAVRNGLSEEAALRAVTLSPAEILGVAKRVGSISPGMDADLVFLSGSPFAPSTTVDRVMVNGEFVYERREADVITYRPIRERAGKDILAIRGGRILTVTQGILPEGLILVENRKIAYVGKGRPVPHEARVIDASGLTAVPGFIDFHSHLGFHMDRTETALRRGRVGGAAGAIGVPPSKLVRLDDPVYRAVAASGVTSILLAPDSAGACSVVKLSGEKAAVVRELAAVKLTVQGGTSGAQSLRDLLQKARKYHDEWEAWERAQKEPARPAPAPTSETGKPPDPISGAWKGTLEAPEQNIKAEFSAEFKLEGTRVTGSFQSQAVGGQPEPVEGTFENGELHFERSQQGSKVEATMKLAGPDHLKGTWKALIPPLELKGTLECRRSAPAAAPEAGASKAELKEPRKDESLEIYRPVFRKEVPVIATARDLPAIETAARILREEFDLDHVLLGGEDAPYAGDLLASKASGVALGPDFLQERKGARLNSAESLAAQGVPFAFHSSGFSSTRTLPLTAAYAVRHGLDAFDALRAVTVTPARLLKLEGRLGSIERGRDADLVLLSGDPFSMTSRVRYVIIDGSIVYEAK